MTFLKNDPRPRATLKQVFLDRFELVVAHFGPPKIPKCLENGLFWGSLCTARALRAALRAHCALLLDYVPPEEPPSKPLGNALRIR